MTATNVIKMQAKLPLCHIKHRNKNTNNNTQKKEKVAVATANKALTML